MITNIQNKFGDWGLGIGGWAPTPIPKPPYPKPQTPCPNPRFFYLI